MSGATISTLEQALKPCHHLLDHLRPSDSQSGRKQDGGEAALAQLGVSTRLHQVQTVQVGHSGTTMDFRFVQSYGNLFAIIKS